MKKIKLILLSIIFILIPALSTAYIDDIKVIYGWDNRMEYSEAPVNIQLLADSTFAMVERDSINSTSTYNNVCKDEPFYNQRTLANCSGFLVGKDLIATAGHCAKYWFDCDHYRWVRNYNDVTLVMDNADIYECKEIVKQVLSNGLDYAIIRLKREVTEVEPLKLQEREVVEKDELFVIGHPAGLPLKVADGARVREIFEYYFSANLDTYGGNSGSAVFNMNTNEVVGILVRGETDFAWDPDSRCRRSKTLPGILTVDVEEAIYVLIQDVEVKMLQK